MFGPDKCGMDNKVHIIQSYKARHYCMTATNSIIYLTVGR